MCFSLFTSFHSVFYQSLFFFFSESFQWYLDNLVMQYWATIQFESPRHTLIVLGGNDCEFSKFSHIGSRRMARVPLPNRQGFH